ncbi:Rust resistance kinase Lr10 [Vitis vinifera]|uniref:non-specific serine/threonine protein kinase n=1 Tax=Vitis vinifera TaxID=29760 RepID=A0A438DEF1_VITVI|nr:Rust resistance kinase Lr10 [Vitis vinifera]
MRGGRDECMTSNGCGDQGPLIRFPFRLKHQPHHCGYPGFELSCTENNQTMLDLPVSIKQNHLVFSPSLAFLSLVTQFMLFIPPDLSNIRIYPLAAGFTTLQLQDYESFKDKLGEGGYGTVYKGKLSDEVFVAVKILNNSQGNGEEFINEVATMGTIHHVNIVRLVGFCADRFNRALIYEYLPNESLEKFIFSKVVKNYSLSWKKLQEIAIGIAKGIEYLHQGCDQRILHFDIKPHNILLDHNFNPKISDFGLAKLCSKEQSAVSMTFFGMLLLEMVGGRKNIDVSVEMVSSGSSFHEIVVQMLEGEGDKLTMPPNPFASTVPTNLSKPGRVFQQELAIISELE